MRVVSALLAALLLLGLTACGQEETKEPETMGEILLQEFETQYQADPQADLSTLAQAVLSQEVVGFQGTTAPVEPGTLMGFGGATIQGFSQGVMFAPLIGAIPFLGYLFRLDADTDGDAFVNTLQDNADLRWNICSQADECIVEQKDDVVFFLMCPRSMEENPAADDGQVETVPEGDQPLTADPLAPEAADPDQPATVDPETPAVP